MSEERLVHVTFVDGDSGQTLAVSRMPPEQLPESFLHATTLNLDGAEWTVRTADPPTRAQFAAPRQLVLTLSRRTTQLIDPREVLFSLPTLNDGLPPEAEPADGTEIVILEDDWRQIELVHAAQTAAVQAELTAIASIYRDYHQGVGFSEIHVRKAVPQPLRGCQISWAELAPLVGSGYLPIRFGEHGMRVQGGFAALRPGDWVVYGTWDGEAVSTLGLFSGPDAPDMDTCTALEALATRHRLILVDWIRGARVEPGEGRFAELLSG